MTQESISPIDWADPFALSQQLTQEERMIREAAHAYAQDKLLPRITEAYLKEHFDRAKRINAGETNVPEITTQLAEDIRKEVKEKAAEAKEAAATN